MKAPQRRAIAAFAACILGNCSQGALIDDEDNLPILLNINTLKNAIVVKDAEENIVMTAKNKLLKWTIFDERIAHFIDLEESGNDYKGYDYASAQYFTLQMTRNKICIYDYETDDYHYFHIQNKCS